jgi:branched-chain amino acid transport system ATP-binding protein
MSAMPPPPLSTSGTPPMSSRGNGKAPLLIIDDLHVSYGAIAAVKGISLMVFPGEIVTLIGGNGAGKSTTMRSISGLLKPKHGTIMFEGNDITGVKGNEVAKLGIAQSPEGRRIFPRMTVQENLELGAFMRRDKAGIAEDIDRVFELFPRLKERIAQKAGTMSGGEQQMLAMGRALMSRPRLLLLDEPSMGLAPLLVETVFNTIKTVNAQGTTVLLVEQNALVALNIANHGYVLETGKISLDGPAKELAVNDEVRKAYLGED